MKTFCDYLGGKSMKSLNSLFLFLFVMVMLPMGLNSAARAETAPGYIVGAVDFPGFTTTSVSIIAVGGGNTSQQTINNSSTYQLAVAGGDSNYSVSASCGLKDADNNTLSVSFTQRNFPVASGATVTNDYVFNPGVIRFQVNVSGGATSSNSTGSWATKTAVSGEKTATYSLGTTATSATSYSWDLPVVPNQQIALTVKINVSGDSGSKNYAFLPANTTAAAGTYYKKLDLQDVAPGAVVVVPLDINYADTVTLNPPNNTGTAAGMVSLIGIPSSDFIRHSANTSNIYTDPGMYSRSYSFNSTQYPTTLSVPTTYFNEGLDYSVLRWSYVNGYSTNQAVTIYPGTTTYFDYQRAGGVLSGKINLSGTVQNEDLSAITVNMDGGRLYNPATGGYSQLENYYGNVPIKRDATAANIKRPSVRDYRLFLPTGDWNISDVTLARQLQSPSRTINLKFTDYTTNYDGKTYFGQPVHIEQGVNEKDLNYCFGSAIFRLRDTNGGLLKSPSISAKGTHVTNGAIDLNVSSITSSYTSSANIVPMAELEIFGPPANYSTTQIRIVTESGTPILYPTRYFSLSCGTTQVFDVPGPILETTTPTAELVTNAQLLPVSGRVVAFGTSTVASVTVNGQAATLTPIPGSSPAEVNFTFDMSLDDGENLITVTAILDNGAQAVEQLKVFVDHWQPTVAITSPVDGDLILTTEVDRPINVVSADAGYGYTLTVALDGTPIHTADGEAPTLTYDGTLNALPVGEHVITATVTDRAGNSASVSNTFSVGIYQPPPILSGLDDQVIEATSASGAIASFDVTATSTCSNDPNRRPLPLRCWRHKAMPSLPEPARPELSSGARSRFRMVTPCNTRFR